MMLFSFHVVAIAVLIAVVGSIAYQSGKKEGIRITKNHYEPETEDLAQSGVLGENSG